MSGNENKISKDNPFMKKGTPAISDKNPFKTKMIYEDNSDGLKRVFFYQKHAERKSDKQNGNN
jgi:hypothetical protein